MIYKRDRSLLIDWRYLEYKSFQICSCTLSLLSKHYNGCHRIRPMAYTRSGNKVTLKSHCQHLCVVYSRLDYWYLIVTHCAARYSAVSLTKRQLVSRSDNRHFASLRVGYREWKPCIHLKNYSLR